MKNDLCGHPRDGEVIITRKLSTANASDGAAQQSNGDKDPLLCIPRNRVLTFTKDNGLQISDVVLTHGESETRFIAAFNEFVMPMLNENHCCLGRDVVSTVEDIENANLKCHNHSSCVILSKDTDVTMILALATSLHGRGLIHVLGESVINIDVLVQSLHRKGLDFTKLSCVYVLAGCDFSAGTYGVTHEHYLRAAIRHKQFFEAIDSETDLDVFELLTLLAYLEKHGFKKMVTLTEKQAFIDNWGSDSSEAVELRRRLREIFTSPHKVGSEEWALDVRRYVADGAKTASELVPPKEHVYMQARRVRLTVFRYWSKANCHLLSPEVVGGCEETYGFSASGEVILERESDVKRIKKHMQGLVAKCRCKGKCSTRQCSCVKRGTKCVGCECDVRCCRNKVTEARMNHLENGGAEESDSAELGSENVEEEDRNDFSSEQATAGNDFTEFPAFNPEMDIEELLGLYGEG